MPKPLYSFRFTKYAVTILFVVDSFNNRVNQPSSNLKIRIYYYLGSMASHRLQLTFTFKGGECVLMFYRHPMSEYTMPRVMCTNMKLIKFINFSVI